MTEAPFTILDEGRAVAVEARIDGDAIRLSPEAVASALGWELKPEGLCKGPVCIPIPPRSAVVTGDGVDLGALASLLQRAVALDREERAAYLGPPYEDRAQALRSLLAPDFTLPDLGGRLHSLAGQRGTKVLLAAWASW